jgi:recombination protein RecA
MHPDEVLEVLDRPQDVRRPRQAVPTGSLGLDIALGGGWTGGRISELYGKTSTGKSALAYHAVANAQKSGIVLWIDDGGFNPLTAVTCGVDLDQLVLFQPDDATRTLEAMTIAVSGVQPTALIVLDSAAHLDTGSRDYAVAMTGLVYKLAKSTVPVLVVNNDKVSPETTGPFSCLVRDVASVRVHLTREALLTRAFVRQAVVPPAGHQIRFLMNFGKIDACHELVLLALDSGVLHKRGSWVYFHSVRLAQGVLGSAKLLGDWPQARTEIQEAVVECLTF